LGSTGFGPNRSRPAISLQIASPPIFPLGGIFMKPIGLALRVGLSASLAIGAFAPLVFAQDATGATGRTEASLAPGSAITVELNSGSDSKKAKPGDTITAHTTESLKSTDDRLILPKGAKIEGHITQATARGKG